QLPMRADRRTGKGFFLVCLCWLSVAAVPSVVGCGPDDLRHDNTGPGRRAQRLALTPEQELELGRRAYLQVLSELRGRILAADHPQTRRVRYVTGKLIRAVGIEPLQREINLRLRGYRFEWEANVARDDQVNAFCLPGGKIIVFTGILDVAQDDDQVAT